MVQPNSRSLGRRHVILSINDGVGEREAGELSVGLGIAVAPCG